MLSFLRQMAREYSMKRRFSSSRVPYERQQTFNITRPVMYHLEEQRSLARLSGVNSDLSYMDSISTDHSSDRSLINNDDVSSIIRKPEMYHLTPVYSSNVEPSAPIKTLRSARKQSNHQKAVRKYMLGSLDENANTTTLPFIDHYPAASTVGLIRKKPSASFVLY